MKSNDDIKANHIYNRLLSSVQARMGSKDTTSNHQLNDIGKSLFGDDYLGTYSSDTLPLKINAGQMYITNTDEARSIGTHWVAVYGVSKNKILIYDSFGRSTKTLFKKDLRITLTDYHSDTQRDAEQLITQDNCGQRCLAWLLLAKHFGVKLAWYV